MRVKELLKEKGITSKQLAEKLGMTETGLSIAIGDKGNPPLKRLQEIADVLEVSVVELFEAKNEGFTALIDHNGQLHRFDSLEDLKGFIQSIV